MPLFRRVNPILGTRDVDRAVSFYVDRLGLRLRFRSGAPPAEYVGFGRDGVELHMQFQSPHEMGTTRLRIQVDDPAMRSMPSTATGTSSATAPSSATPPGARASSRSTTRTETP